MPALRRRQLLTGAAALTGSAAVGLSPGATAVATGRRPEASRPPSLTAGDRAVVGRVDARRALRHLKVLCEEIGWRVAGTSGEHRAARYIAGVLRDLGYAVTLQPFPVADKHLAEMKAPHVHWQCGAAPRGAVGSARGRIVDLGTATEVTEDVTGELVLFTRVAGGETAQAKAAAAKGAAAVLIANAPSGGLPEHKAAAFTPSLTEDVPIPVLGVAQYHGEQIRERVPALELTVAHHSGPTSYNVLAERRATLPGPEERKVVIVSAHYDGVPGSPGANDDGSGTALCLELARVLRRLPTRQDIRIALWGSEEYGLIGARHYVSRLTEEEVGRISGCFQNDMVATGHPPADTYWLLSVDGADNATTAAVAGAAERLGRTGRVKGPAARGSSDHEAFFERGVDAGNFSWRGGEAPSRLEPLYHTPEDTIAENISLRRLQMSLELIGCAVYDMAYDMARR